MTLLEKWPILSGFVCGLFQKISKICPDWYVASSAIVRGPDEGQKLVDWPYGYPATIYVARSVYSQ